MTPSKLLVFALTTTTLIALSPKRPAATPPVFSFHSGFWINLHHFLYYQALLHTTTTGRNTRKLSYRDTAAITSLDKTEQQYWQQAIDYYQKNLIHMPTKMAFGSGHGRCM